jgi:release factor glutamine methyltransferase
MSTVAEAIREVQSRLTGPEFDSPRLDAELLVGHVLGINRTRLLANLRDEFPAKTTHQLDPLVARRVLGEPISLLLGQREFYGLMFAVTPAVLTPRPETELLVEWALAWLAIHNSARVIDVGTGSGAIAIAIAANTPPSTEVLAIDLSGDALAIARQNAKVLVPDRIEFRQSDLLEALDEKADLILANLPYLRPAQISERRELQFEPALALDGGRDGLDLVRRLIDQLPSKLGPSGAAALELAPDQTQTVASILEQTLPGAEVQIHVDLSRRPRVVTASRI